MPTIEFRLDTTGIRHTFIVLDNGAGVTQQYGFAPAVPGQAWGARKIYDESVSHNGDEHPWDHTTGPIEVTRDQYNRAADEINYAIARPPFYNLPATMLWHSAGKQCATWANDIAKAGGFMDKLPWGSNGWNLYGQSFWTKLDKYWKRNPHAGINDIDYDINGNVNSNFIATRNLVIRRDPLVLDLDGDRLELLPASGAVLFNHNADGIKTGTGWVHPNDGFLVRDLNGNGVIDTGRELVGEDTLKSNGLLAANGFDALRELDSNGDDQITSADTVFSELKVWRDLNQDGISQANELSNLGQLNITSISTQGTTSGPQIFQLINNNQAALSTTFTQNTLDGPVSRTVGVIDQEFNGFFAQSLLGEPVAITARAQGLPQMNGAGMVRNTREAASLDGGGSVCKFVKRHGRRLNFHTDRINKSFPVK